MGKPSFLSYRQAPVKILFQKASYLHNRFVGLLTRQTDIGHGNGGGTIILTNLLCLKFTG